MKKTLIAILALIISIPVWAQQVESAKESIKKVIQEAYVDGLHNNGDLSKTRAGFHEGFELLGVQNNNLTKLPIYTWLEYAESRRKENPDPPAKSDITTCKFIQIDATGNSAVAKIELYKTGKHIFTDYLSLYKFDEGWRIVSKIYYRIPE